MSPSELWQAELELLRAELRAEFRTEISELSATRHLEHLAVGLLSRILIFVVFVIGIGVLVNLSHPPPPSDIPILRAR